jgi:hypothetical protein
LLNRWSKKQYHRAWPDIGDSSNCPHCSDQNQKKKHACPDLSHGQSTLSNGRPVNNLLSFFSQDELVVDIMHAFFRYSDAIQNIFLEKVIIPYRLTDRLVSQCNLYNIRWYPKSNEKSTDIKEWSSLMGPDKLKLFSFDFIDSLTEIWENSDVPPETQAFWLTVWKYVIDINQFLNCPHFYAHSINSVHDISQQRFDHNQTQCKCEILHLGWFRRRVQLLCEMLISVAGKSVITPYLHVLHCHVPTMYRRWGSLAPFSTSAQELKNSLETFVQFRGTNQHQVPKALLANQLVRLYFYKNPTN